MSTIAIVIAGGVGSRMGHGIPKQFISVGEKPVLVWTLEAFERHPGIDAIEVVCVEGWGEAVRGWAREFGISKLRWVVPAGDSAQESIAAGVDALAGELGPDDTVVVHDGVRPVLDSYVLDSVLSVCAERGCAATSTPYNEQMFTVDPADPSVATGFVPRETLRRVATPQAYRYGELADAYREAGEHGVGMGPSDYANTMWVALGRRLWLAKGSDRNVKLTTPENLESFRAWVASRGEGASHE